MAPRACLWGCLPAPLTRRQRVLARSRSGVAAPCCSNPRPCCSRAWTGNPGGVLSAARPTTWACLHWEHSPGADWNLAASPQTLQAAGLPEDSMACWHARAGWVRTRAPGAQAAGPAGHCCAANCPVATLQRTAHGTWQALDKAGQPLAEAEVVVLATGPASNTCWPPCRHRPALAARARPDVLGPQALRRLATAVPGQRQRRAGGPCAPRRWPGLVHGLPLLTATRSSCPPARRTGSSPRHQLAAPAGPGARRRPGAAPGV